MLWRRRRVNETFVIGRELDDYARAAFSADTDDAELQEDVRPEQNPVDRDAPWPSRRLPAAPIGAAAVVAMAIFAVVLIGGPRAP